MYLEIAKEMVSSEINVKNIERIIAFLGYLNNILDIGTTNLLTPHYKDEIYKDALDAHFYLRDEPKVSFLHSYHWILWDRLEKKFSDFTPESKDFLHHSSSGIADECSFSFNHVHSFNVGHDFEVYATDKPITINYTFVLLGFVLGPSYKYFNEPKYLSEAYSYFNL